MDCVTTGSPSLGDEPDWILGFDWDLKMKFQVGLSYRNISYGEKNPNLNKAIKKKRKVYVYHTFPYCEKPEIITDACIGDTLTLVKRICEGYEQSGYPLRGSNISMDRCYTAIPLAKWLYSKHITCIGAIQTNRKGLPKEIKK